MRGFFHEEKVFVVKNKARSKKPKKEGCEACGLYQKCITPRMKVSGKGKKRILIIGEAPGKSEDEEGVQFVGEAGKTLRRKLRKHGIELDRDCWKTNSLICHPPGNKTPTARQLSLCHHYLDETIEKLKPEKIILFGKSAVQAFLLGRESVTALEKWVGNAIPDQKYKCWVFPTYHPQYLNYNQDDRVLFRLFDSHLKQAFSWKKKFIDRSGDKKKVKILYDPEKIYAYLNSIKEGDTIFFDIETTGIKPYAEGHKIVTISFAELSKDVAYAFPYLSDDKEFIRLLKDIMRNKNIKKVAHNLKFENTWLKIISRISVKGWIFCTMVGAHIIDQRTGITGLKHLTYIYQGIAGYNKDVEDLLKAKDKKNSNSFNRISEIDPDDLLLYNGLDSLYTRRAYIIEMKQMTESHWKAYKLFHEGLIEFGRAERAGIMVDPEYYHTEYNKLTARMKKIDTKIKKSKEAHIWQELHETNPEKFKEFKHSSSDQLRILLYDKLGYEPTKMTKNDNPSADQEALEGFDTPFIKNILKHRKLIKLRDTYLSGFIREEVDGILHPFFNLNLVKTYRSSSSNVNFHNIPKHDEKAQKITRSGIIPRPGRQLAEVDYSGIEVRISACYHKDPRMLKYIEDPKSDMHRDQAMELFIKDDVTKQERFLAKNNFVFAQFYGDYYANCAKNIWKELKSETMDHLVSVGLGKYRKFERHVRDVEHDFWFKKFKVYNEWREWAWEDFQRRGEFTFYTDFRCAGHLSRNEVLNYRIQGTAFHCLLWSFNKLSRYLRKHKFGTKVIGQIHDSIVLDMVVAEKEQLKPIIRKIMCEDIRKQYPWIIVPLDIEMEVSEVDGNWYQMIEEAA